MPQEPTLGAVCDLLAILSEERMPLAHLEQALAWPYRALTLTLTPSLTVPKIRTEP